VEDSTCWNYVSGASGTATFPSTCLDGVGQYVAWLFYNNGYQELAGPVNFSVAPSQTAPAPQFASTFGQHGNGQLADPFGVAVAPDHSVWVADRGASLVEQFSPSGKFVRAIGSHVLRHPDGVAVDSARNVRVADTGTIRSSSSRSPAANCSHSARTALATAYSTTRRAWPSTPPETCGCRSGQQPDRGVLRRRQLPVAVRRGDTGRHRHRPAGNLWVSSPSYADGNAVYEFTPGGTNLQYYGSTQRDAEGRG
jgi:hypothetical protein